MIVLRIVIDGKIKEDNIAHLKFLIQTVHDSIPSQPAKTSNMLSWLNSSQQLFEYMYEALRDAFNERPDLEHIISRRLQMERHRIKAINDVKSQITFTLGGM